MERQMQSQLPHLQRTLTIEICAVSFSRSVFSAIWLPLSVILDVAMLRFIFWFHLAMRPNLAIPVYYYLWSICQPLVIPTSITQSITVELWRNLIIHWLYQHLCFVEWVFGWRSSGHGHRCIKSGYTHFWKGTWSWCWTHPDKGACLNRCFCLLNSGELCFLLQILVAYWPLAIEFFISTDQHVC
jgi:hypothetical protein